MKIIIPMAGIGKKMRPQTLTIPKPLITIAGKPIVQRLIEEINKSTKENINEIVFIIGEFGEEVENNLRKIAGDLKIKHTIYYQKKAKGTAHAIYCARDSLEGNLIVAFADTLFKSDSVINTKEDGIIWTKTVKDPSSFGVVKYDKEGIVTEFIEKPAKYVSDKAIIGIYYFKDGIILKKMIEYVIKYNQLVGKEYQLTTALENMKNDGIKFITKEVKEWFDCGNKDATIFAHDRILDSMKGGKLVADNAKIQNSVIIQPCYIDEKVCIKNSVVGPYTSIGKRSNVFNSLIKNSIVQENTELHNINIKNSIIGNHVDLHGEVNEVNIGDYTTIYH